MTFEFLKPVFSAQQRIQIERKTRVDFLWLDVDYVKQVSLPANVQAVEGHNWQFEVTFEFMVFKRPQTVLSVYDFDWRYCSGPPVAIKILWQLQSHCLLAISLYLD